MDQKAYIDQAAEHFRTLLAQQLQRQERMAQGSPAKDFAHMGHIVIGLIPGDGIGPIIMAQARRVLEKLLADEITHGRVELRDIQGLTIENRTAQGKAIPEDVLAAEGPHGDPQGRHPGKRQCGHAPGTGPLRQRAARVRAGAGHRLDLLP